MVSRKRWRSEDVEEEMGMLGDVISIMKGVKGKSNWRAKKVVSMKSGTEREKRGIEFFGWKGKRVRKRSKRRRRWWGVEKRRLEIRWKSMKKWRGRGIDGLVKRSSFEGEWEGLCLKVKRGKSWRKEKVIIVCKKLKNRSKRGGDEKDRG